MKLRELDEVMESPFRRFIKSPYFCAFSVGAVGIGLGVSFGVKYGGQIYEAVSNLF